MALADNLVSYWKMDESSGTAADSVASNTLTNNATVTYTAGKINNAATYNGTTQYHSITDASQTGLDITGNLSISFWINFSSYAGATLYMPITKINFATAGASRAYAVEINVTASNKLDFEGGGGSGSVRKGVAWTPSTGTWYHIVVVYTAAAGTVDFYINSTAQTQQTGFNTSLANSGDAFTIGAALDTAVVSYQIPGSIDEVGIWNRAITSTEVSSLYNSGSGLQYPFTSGNTSHFLPMMGYGN